MSNYMLNNQCGLRYLDKTHKEQLASLEERLTQRLDDVQETNKTTVKNEDLHLARLDEAHQEQLASLEARLTKRLDDMNKTNAESLHSNRLSSQCGLAYLEKMHKAELTSLGARLTKRMGDVLVENNKATLLSLVKSQDGHRAQLDEAHQERLASLDARLSERLTVLAKDHQQKQCNLVAAHQQHLDYLEKAHKEHMASLEARLSQRLTLVEASSQRKASNNELIRVKAVLASVDYRTRAQDPRCSDALRGEFESKARRLVAYAADLDKAGTIPPIRLSPQVKPEPPSPETSSQTTTVKAGWENPVWRAAYIAADKETRRSMIRKAQWC